MEKDTWKQKSIAKTKEIKALKKRLKEVIDNRDDWKKVAKDFKSRHLALENQLKKTKNSIEINLSRYK